MKRRRFGGWPTALAVVGAMLLGVGIASAIFTLEGRRDPSNAPEGEERLPAPRNLTAHVEGTSIELDWDAPEPEPNQAHYYEVFRDDELVEMVATTEWTDEDPIPGHRHRYRVRAAVWRNEEGKLESASSSEVEAEIADRDPEAAQLSGTWSLDGDATESSQDWRASAEQVDDWAWRFVPTCPVGPCDVVASVRLAEEGWLQMRLKRSMWGDWSGSLRQESWWCARGSLPSSVLSIRIRSVEGTSDRDVWTAERLEGTASVRFPQRSACRDSFISWELDGELRSLSESQTGSA